MSRVFITGIGPITPIGIGRKELWAGALAGRRGVKSLDRFDTSDMRSKVAGQINDFDAVSFLNRKQAQRTERFSQFAIAAARLAFEDAAMTPSAPPGPRFNGRIASGPASPASPAPFAILKRIG